MSIEYKNTETFCEPFHFYNFNSSFHTIEYGAMFIPRTFKIVSKTKTGKNCNVRLQISCNFTQILDQICEMKNGVINLSDYSVFKFFPLLDSSRFVFNFNHNLDTQLEFQCEILTSKSSVVYHCDNGDCFGITDSTIEKL